jgi:hypothetical protein
MMTSPSFNGGRDNALSSKGTMEAVLAPEDAATSPSHNPLVSPPPMIPFSHHLMKNAN